MSQDMVKALELLRRAAQLGSVEAHERLGDFYDSEGNMKKAKNHWEIAAIVGSAFARGTPLVNWNFTIVTRLGG